LRLRDEALLSNLGPDGPLGSAIPFFFTSAFWRFFIPGWTGQPGVREVQPIFLSLPQGAAECTTHHRIATGDENDYIRLPEKRATAPSPPP
jgi:hypothetical protein